MINRILPRKLAVDTDERSMQPGDLKQAVNITIDADSDGDSGVVKFADGNVAIEPSDPESGIARDGTNTVIGSVADEELGVVYFFVHNDQGNHGVYAYSDKTKTYRLIFKDASLDFDKEGFVKGDIVRIKKKPDLVQASINVSQGEGGVQPDFDDGGGVGPADAILAKKIEIKIVKDLISIVELHKNIHDEASAISNIASGDYRVDISGTYIPETTSQPIRFYDNEVDLNLNPDYLESIGLNATAITIGGGQSNIEFEFDAFVDPQVADGDFSMTYVIKSLNQIPTQGNSPFDFIPSETTLNTKTITQDDFSGSSYDESGFARVLGVEGKFKDNLTVNNVFSLPPEAAESGAGTSAGALLDRNERLANNYVDPNGSGDDVQTDDNLLTQRTARVRLKLDYTQSEAYAAAQDYLEWLDYTENGPDGWPNEQDDTAVTRNAARTPDDPDNYVTYTVVTRCPFSFRWRLWATNAGTLSRFNPDGISYSYQALYNQARQQLSDADSNVYVSSGITSNGTLQYTGVQIDELDDADNYYFSLQSALNAATNAYDLPYQQTGGELAGYFNMILVPYVASSADGTFDFLVNPGYEGTITCDVVPPDAIFNPKIFVIPVDENETDPVRSYVPRNFPTIDTIDAWAQYLSNPIKTFDIDVPMSGPLDGTTRDVIVTAYNDGINQFRQQEEIINNNLYSYAFQPVNGTGTILTTGTDGMFDIGDTQNLLNLSNTVAFSFSGNPAQTQVAGGRRMRIPLKKSGGGQVSVAIAGVEINGNRREVRCIPHSFIQGEFNPVLNGSFCFGTGFQCLEDDARLPTPTGPGLADPVRIEQGDLQEGINDQADPPKDPTEDDPRTGDDPRVDTKPPTSTKPSTLQAQQTLNRDVDQLPATSKKGYNPKSKY